MEYRANHYYTYDEITELLEQWAGDYADRLSLFSIGKTYQGREIHGAAVTLGGEADKKPGILISGNLHSRELVGSSVVLYALHHFLKGSEADDRIRQLLAEKTLYFIPRVNADGAEANVTGPWNYRGSLRKFHEEEDGVYAADIDGDGEILKMRIEAEDGQWKPYPKEPRLMVKREAGDTEGPFYHLLDEGFLRGLLTDPPRQARNPYDLDPNREFPFDWSRDAIGETMRPSAGHYPLMECETRALADFVLSHKNIGTVIDEHSYMAAYISPMEFCKEFPAPAEDSELFAQIGQKAHEETGYLTKGVFPPQFIGVARGGFTIWCYYDLGIIAWCNENWNPRKLFEKIDKENPVKCMYALMPPAEQLEERIRILHWDDTENGGRAFEPWRSFDHPDLGKVELGGLREKFVIDNPPEHMLEEECRIALNFINQCADAAPCLAPGQLTAKRLGADLWEVSLSLKNKGLFPSYGTRRALESKLTDSGHAVLKTESGEKFREKLPQISGGGQAWAVWENVCGKAGEKFSVTVETARAGCFTVSGILQEEGK